MCVGLTAAACTTPEEAADIPRPPLEADEATLDEVRSEIAHAWDAYVAHAWGRDELRPLSRDGADWHAVPLGLTIVDAADTLAIAGLTSRYDAALAWIVDELDFDADITVSAFETNIRHMGGLLSVYERSQDARVLAKARDLGDRLLPAFASPTGMPYRLVNLATGAAEDATTSAADAGTWLLELEALSRHTGDDRYARAARDALEALHATRDPNTGLIPTEVDVERGVASLELSHVGSGVDSYLESLAKGARLTGEAHWHELYLEAVEPLHTHTADVREDGTWYGYASLTSGELVLPVMGSLDCFFPGLLALEGDLARAVPAGEACWTLWSTFGLAPDAYAYRTGLLFSPNHDLRPEVIETLFYLYRRTGDEVWRERGRQVLADLRAHCRTEDGYTSIGDVQTMERIDGMPSFFLAETLKYLYLLFADEDALDLDAVVFNTEAHPLSVAP